MQKPIQGCERSSLLSALRGVKRAEVKTNVVFVKDFAPEDLLIDESKLRSLLEKPCLSGKHDFRKLKTRYVSIGNEMHDLRRHQEILRILSFRNLALDFNDSSLAEKVSLVFLKIIIPKLIINFFLR
jgi:hypothetical protein